MAEKANNSAGTAPENRSEHVRPLAADNSHGSALMTQELEVGLSSQDTYRRISSCSAASPRRTNSR